MNPDITFNGSTGSDVAASGAGPAVAVTGSAAAHTGGSASTTITLTNSPDLSGVATDGSHVLWLKTAAGRQFSKITGKGSGQVTVEDSFNIDSGSAVNYAIGGKRATVANADSVLLFTADAKSYWFITLEGQQSFSAELTITAGGGFGGDGYTVLRGSAAHTVMTWSSNTSMVNCQRAWLFRDLDFRNTHASHNSSSISNSGFAAFHRCVIGHATDQIAICLSNSGYLTLIDCEVCHAATGQGVTSVGGYLRLDNCWVHDCADDGIVTSQNINGVTSIENCLITGNNIGIDAGMNFYSTLTIKNCTIDGSTSHGVTFTNNISTHGLVFVGNNVTNNGGYGVTSGSSPVPIITNARNNYFGNSSGARNNFPAGDDDAAIDPDYPGGSDYTSAPLAGLGYPAGAVGFSGTESFPEIGAAQTAGGGTPDYPAEGDVRDGVDYADGDFTGTLELPVIGNVRSGTQYGTDGTELTGTLTLPGIGDVQLDVQFGAAGTEFTGTFAVPAIGNVRADVQYGAAGTEFTGNLVLPDVDDVTFATPFGANATEFSGTFVIPAEADVEAGVDYGGGDQTFTGNLELPAEADVRAGIQYGALGTEFTGELSGGGGDFPAESDVRSGVDYDSGNFTGTLVLPAAGNVREGIQFGGNGTEFTGTLFVPSLLADAVTIVDLADAVAATLAAVVSSAGGQISRQYVPRIKLEEMGDELFVTVVPNSFQSERLDRGSYGRDLVIDVAVQKRSATAEESDALVELVDQVAHVLWQVPRLAGCTLLNVQVDPVYSAEHLNEKGVFTSVLRATYRQGRGLS